jgi:hypothetical protein
LANALHESQTLKSRPLHEITSHLNAYRSYCDKAAEHMAAAECESPGAVSILRKCNPLIKEKIRTTIAEIQQTALGICQITLGSGTVYESLGIEINRTAKSLSTDDYLKKYKCSVRITSILAEFCRLLPQNKRGYACEIIKQIETEEVLSDKLNMIELALTYLQPNIEMEACGSANKLSEIHEDIRSLDQKLNTIVFDLSKIKVGTGNIASNLWAVRDILNRIEVEQRSAQNSDEISNVSSEPGGYNEHVALLIDAKVSELEIILKQIPNRDDIKDILEKLERLKPSEKWEWIGRISDLIAIFDAAIKVVTFVSSIKLLIYP